MIGIDQLEENAREIIEWLDTHPGGMLYTNRGPGKSFALRRIFARGPWENIYVVSRTIQRAELMRKGVHNEYPHIPKDIIDKHFLYVTTREEPLSGISENAKVYCDDVVWWKDRSLMEHNQFAGAVSTNYTYVAVKQLEAGYDPQENIDKVYNPWEWDVRI